MEQPPQKERCSSDLGWGPSVKNISNTQKKDLGVIQACD